MTAWSFQAPNPITNFLVGIEFSGPIPSPTLKAISALHTQFKRELPRKVEQPNFTFPFPGFPALQAPGPQQLSVQQQIGAVSFDQIKDDGSVIQALAVGPNNVTFMKASYSRWEEFQPISDRLVKTISEIALQFVSATGVILTAMNRFEWRGDGKPDLGKLLNPAPKYVAPNMLSCNEHCHSFHGFLRQLTTPLDAQYIQNININTADGPEAEKIVNIAFSHRTIFPAPIGLGSNLFSSTPGTRGLFQKLCDLMHESNNQLFVDVVHPDISTTIPGLLQNA